MLRRCCRAPIAGSRGTRSGRRRFGRSRRRRGAGQRTQPRLDLVGAEDGEVWVGEEWERKCLCLCERPGLVEGAGREREDLDPLASDLVVSLAQLREMPAAERSAEGPHEHEDHVVAVAVVTSRTIPRNGLSRLKSGASAPTGIVEVRPAPLKILHVTSVAYRVEPPVPGWLWTAGGLVVGWLLAAFATGVF